MNATENNARMPPFYQTGVGPFVLGLAAGAGWALLHWLYAPPMSLALAALVVFPLFEESIKFGCLSLWKRNVGGLARAGGSYGAGFGLTEASLRWWDAATAENGTSLGFVAPIAPLLLHVVLGVVAWRFIVSNRLIVGFVLCLGLHILHNALGVQLIVARPSLSTALSIAWVQIVLYLGLLFYLVTGPRRTPR